MYHRVIAVVAEIVRVAAAAVSVVMEAIVEAAGVEPVNRIAIAEPARGENLTQHKRYRRQ